MNVPMSFTTFVIWDPPVTAAPALDTDVSVISKPEDLPYMLSPCNREGFCL